MRQVPLSPLSFDPQRVANVPEHPPPSTRLRSCAHIANRRLSRIIGASNFDPWSELRDSLNRSLLGWSNYFCHGTCRSAFRSIDRYVYERVRDFLARRHKVAGRGTRRFSWDVVYGELGLLRLERLPLAAPPCTSR